MKVFIRLQDHPEMRGYIRSEFAFRTGREMREGNVCASPAKMREFVKAVIDRAERDLEGASDLAFCAACRLSWEQLRSDLKRQVAKFNRRTREEAYRSCGLVKVKGALGGTYWE